MFTQLFDQFVRSIDTMPIVVVYAIIAAWVGAENLGIPAPLEVMLLFAGSLIGLGRLSAPPVLVTVLLGSLVCSALAYFLGRRLGAHALTRAGKHIGLTHERIAALDTWLRSRGIIGVACVRIIPGIRLFSSYVMGIADIPLVTFAFGITVATLGYSSIWIFAGILLGNNYRAPLHYLDTLGFYGVALAAAALIAGLAVHHMLGRRTLRHLTAHHSPKPPSHLAAKQVARASAQQEPDAADSALPAIAAPSSSTQLLTTAGALDEHITNAVSLRGPTLLAQVDAPWPSWVVATLATLWAAIAIMLLFLSVAAHRYAVFPLDMTLAHGIQRLRGTVFATLIYPAGDLQWYLPSIIAYVIVFAILLVLRLYRVAIFVALSSFGADLVHLMLNVVVARPRPYGVAIPALTTINLGSASYPSGHVAHVVGLYGFLLFLCVLAIRARPRLRLWLLAVQAICVYFLAGVGISRVLEGQHWPSDVMGGYLVGALVVIPVIALYHGAAMHHAATHPAERRDPECAAISRARAIVPQD